MLSFLLWLILQFLLLFKRISFYNSTQNCLPVRELAAETRQYRAVHSEPDKQMTKQLNTSNYLNYTNYYVHVQTSSKSSSWIAAWKNTWFSLFIIFTKIQKEHRKDSRVKKLLQSSSVSVY